MKRKKLLLPPILSLLLFFCWPTPARRTVLHAYSDNAFGMWGLTLYLDGHFDVYLPTNQSSGRFRLTGDTIELYYSEKSAGFPAAYLINRQQQRLDKLENHQGKWVNSPNTNWMALTFDSTRHYFR
ncbi:hypothetical protein [Hymenobacter pini]|uniref:hypothetical protein n=1 Tax=Hymenobacter pini TaxID=2880879 RepID=UPI001CF1FFD7|nr:hypothetical protein [Hymenobacter pini]MCA8832766.1 hypothetical protein [Hymenobacter pini]